MSNDDSTTSAASAASAQSAPSAPSAAEASPAVEQEETDTNKFADLGIDGRVLAAVSDLGYEQPSPIQAATIPLLLEGRDVVGLAQTGTGKTAAFAVPALSKVAELADINGPADHPQVLVLAPTRELALQVAEAFTSYAKYLDGLTILPVYGGSPYGPQLSALRRGAQVVVGTPGRVIDHLDRGSLDLSQLSYMVLDEADEMLRMGFAEEVDHILEATPDEKQVALFSATMPRQIRRIADKYLDHPEQIAVDQASTPGANIRQRYIQVMHNYKLDVMSRILETEEHDGIIAFVRTKMATEEVATKLKARGFRAAAIHGDINQVQRERTVDQLRNGTIDILVATDVAARGLDVERISHVFNYDIPHDTESYVHRIGRTGRAGRQGDAVLFITPRERYLLKHIEKATGGAVIEAKIPGIEAVNSSRLERLAFKVGKTLSTTELGPYRELVTSYLAEHDVDAVEVAAALAHLAQGGRPLLTEEIPTLPAKKQREGRDARNKRGRDEFGSRGPSKPVAPGNATYRISVGHRQRVLPGSIVGALANEGGLHSNDIGSIDIRSDHSLVELPENLPQEVLNKLSDTRIGGRPIHLEKDTGRRPNRERRNDDRDDRRGGSRGGYRGDRRDDRRDRFQERDSRRDYRKGNNGDSKPWERNGDRRNNRFDDRGENRRGRDEDRNSGYRGRGDRDGSKSWGNRDDRGGKFGKNQRHDGDFRGDRKGRKPRHH